MNLQKLLEGVEIVKIIGKTDVEVSGVLTNSNALTKGSLFICINGLDYDGHDYVAQAEKFGAIAIVTQRQVSTSLTQIIVEDSRKAMSIIASNFYNNADKKIKLIGVIGTNGKTTTSYMIYNILKNNKIKCGLIGTNGVFYNDDFIETNLTTPDPLILHKIFFEMVEAGVETVVMEVSAHAIYLNKMVGLNFEAGVFTNLSQDHLDFFKDMNTYEKAKIKFFRENLCKCIVTNNDDQTGKKIGELFPKAITYAIDNPADVFAIDIEELQKSTKFIVNLFDCIFEVNLNLIGKFNIYNALAASTVTALYGIKPPKVIEGLQILDGVNGRLELVENQKSRIYIDYAHTPDGLEKVLRALKKTCKSKLICLFGCGGNRDKDKRKIMGEVSAKNADFTIITTDNPRFEDPMDIIHDIEKGVLKVNTNYIIVQDRKSAIEYALKKLEEGDTLLIAGKGCEKYQDVLGIKTPYNDKDIVNDFLRG